MTITQIKEKLGFTELALNVATDKDDNATDWLRAWDNDSRTAVSIHKELLSEIQADANIASLGLQSEKRSGEQGDYMAHRIVKYTPPVATL